MTPVARHISACACGAALWVSPGGAQQLFQVPSGQSVELSEVLVDNTSGQSVVRFRFLAPQIAREGGNVPYDVAALDIDALCKVLVLPYLTEFDLDPKRVVISLSDRDVPFGTSNPAATQFFEAYRPENADCIWMEF